MDFLHLPSGSSFAAVGGVWVSWKAGKMNEGCFWDADCSIGRGSAIGRLDLAGEGVDVGLP